MPKTRIAVISEGYNSSDFNQNFKLHFVFSDNDDDTVENQAQEAIKDCVLLNSNSDNASYYIAELVEQKVTVKVETK